MMLILSVLSSNGVSVSAKCKLMREVARWQGMGKAAGGGGGKRKRRKDHRIELKTG
jgi:hypothetical protein